MFVDSASRLQRPYGTRDKSEVAILAVVKRFIADMGVPRAFRNDDGAEYTTIRSWSTATTSGSDES